MARAVGGAAVDSAGPVHIGAFVLLPGRSPGVNTYLCGEQALLHRLGSGEAVGLSPLATFAWLALEQGWGGERLVGELTARGVSREQALELLGQLDDLERADSSVPMAPAPQLPEPASFVAGKAYSYLDSSFTLSLPPSLAAGLEPLLSPARVEGEVVCSLKCEVVEAATGLSLRLNGWERAGSLDEASVTPLLIDSLRKFAYRHSDYLMALHSALLVGKGTAVLLPGRSGSGKSTLAAALMANGFECATDEVVVLGGDGAGVRTMPFGIGLKSGSWSLLSAYHPKLVQQSVHTRFDGQSLRYLPIQGVASPQGISAIVFPTYRSGVAAVMHPLDPVQALQRLCQAGYDLGGILDTARLEAILEWISPIPAYGLVYGDLEQAVSLMEPLR